MTLFHSPSVQAPAAYSNLNLQGPQLAARMAVKYVTAYANIAAADTAAQADSTEIVFPTGTYNITVNTTITSDIRMLKGAKFVVSTGVKLTLVGNVEAAPRQIFSLTGTGVVQFGAGAVNNQFNKSPPVTYPEWWGAGGVNGPGDDSAAILAAVAAHRPIVFMQDYPVSQVEFTGNELHIDFNGFALLGVAGVATKSVLGIKCGYSTLKRVKVSAQFNANYECAIQWYTNDLNSFYPGFNRIYGIWPRAALIGLCIGALPSQGAIPAQGTVNAVGTASDAPLSESMVEGYMTDASTGTVISVYARQPNGKVTFVNPIMLGSHAGWSSGFTAANTCALVVNNPGTEISISGGEIIQNSEPLGTLFQVGSGRLFVDGAVIESSGSSFLGSGDVTVTLKNIVDFGFNFGTSYSPFLVHPSTTGALNIESCVVNYPSGDLLANSPPLVKGATNLLGSFGVNTAGFIVNLSNLELRDVPFSPLNSAASYIPPIIGVEASYKNIRFTSFNATPAQTALYRIDDETDRFTAVVDQSSYTVTAYGANGNNVTSGGWTFTVSDVVNGKWGSVASGITINDRVIDKCIQLFAPAAGTTTGTSPKFGIRPGKNYTIRAWVKGGVTGSTIRLKANWFKFDASASATASTDCLNAPDSAIGATFMPVIFTVQAPKDSNQMQLVIDAENGATASFADFTVK